MVKLSELNINAKKKVGYWATDDPSISGIETQASKIKEGEIFFALEGTQNHGAKYTDEAIKMGASLVITDYDGFQIIKKNNVVTQIPIFICDNVREILTEMCYKFFPSLPSNLMAITGTNGKTSVVNFIQQLLELNDLSCLTIGTLGVKGVMNISTNITTPTQIDLYKILSNAKKLRTDYACIEASSHAIHQGRLAGLKFKSLFFSNLSQDHLDYHGDIENYFYAKLSILDGLDKDARIFANIDDDFGKKFIEISRERGFIVETIGFSKNADLVLKSIRQSINSQIIEFNYKDEKITAQTNLIGSFQALNLGMAALACRDFGLSLTQVIKDISKIRPIPGRMEFVGETIGGARVYIDFAHSPDALEKLLNTFRQETSSKIVVVFGAGGERDKEKRKNMGLIAHNLADKIYVTDDNPRNEDPASIRREIIEYCPNAEEVSDRAVAIYKAIEKSGLGDTVLITGKGHEKSQIVGDQNFPFDDYEQASIAIESIRKLKG